MSTAPQKRLKNDLRPDKYIFWPAVLSIILISIPMLIYPKSSEEIIGAIYAPFAANFGTLYLWITIGLIGLCVYFACSRYGDIKFGEPDEKPEFSLFSWVAMIFSSAVGGAIMFWAIVEPLTDIMSPPQYAEAMSTQAYDWSLAYLLMHWGPNAWCTYFITALPIAYMFHIRRHPVLRISSTAEMVLGRQSRGIIGRITDIFYIIGMLFCTAVTMCISLPTVAAALHTVFGIEASFRLEITVLAVSSVIAGYTVWAGLSKGIKRLADINVIVALAMVAYAAICGPTASLLDIFTNGIGKWLGNYWNMTFWTSPFSNSTFPRDWTIFYALFWAGFGPFMGLFIARISRGRTVREIIGWGMAGCCAGGFLVHGVFGSYTLYVQYHGIVDAVSILRESGGPAAMMAVLDTLPFSKIVLLIYCAFSTFFLATTVNSGCYVVSAVATTRIGINDDPARWHRTFWAVVQTLLALGLLSIGGLGVAKIFGNFAGAFMVLPTMLVTISWLKIIKRDGHYLLCNYVNTECFSPSPLEDELGPEKDTTI